VSLYSEKPCFLGTIDMCRGINIDSVSEVTIRRVNFQNTISVSQPPIYVRAPVDTLNLIIQDCTIQNSECGGINVAFGFESTKSIITIEDNIVTNNDSGALGTFGSAIIIDASASFDGQCSLALTNNTISDNASNAVYI
jgi:hypothetical protein